MSAETEKHIRQIIEVKFETLINQVAKVEQRIEKLKLVAPCGRNTELNNEAFIKMFSADVAIPQSKPSYTVTKECIFAF